MSTGESTAKGTAEDTAEGTKTSTPAHDPAGTTVIFDLGGVVLRWDPRLAYGAVLPEDEIDGFLEQIGFPQWNQSHDAGRPWADGEQELITRHPDRADAIRAYRRYFVRAIPGMVPGTNGVIAELQQAGVRLLALTNWAADTFAETRSRFGVLDRFESIVVSGEERLAKPDPAIFRLLLDRHRIEPGRAVFVDDSPVNCAAAAGLGLDAIRFTGAADLRSALLGRGLLGRGLIGRGLIGDGPLPGAPAEPVLHLAVRAEWEQAVTTGHYPWSTRGISYEREGYVHCSFPDQVAAVRRRSYADLDDADLVVLELDPARLAPSLVVESGPLGRFPHLFRPLTPADVTGLSTVRDRDRPEATT